MASVLYIVVPCYNEEEMLPITAQALLKKLDSLIALGRVSKQSRIMFVDDGSKDKTWEIIEKLSNAAPAFVGIKLSRNRGHQNALLAGLMTAKDRCDITVSMDADLQDDVDAVDRFLDEYEKGAQIVYGVRSSRDKDTAFKRNTARMYYRTLEHLGVEITYDHADYRLMSKEALEGLARFKEVNLFLRGLVPMVGYKSATVKYVRNEREKGESKYPLKKMISFAIEGITSLSVKPIRFITFLGIFVFLVSIILLIRFFVIWCMGKAVAGWATIVISIWGIGGLQLLAIGIIGEYIGKIYLETKQRPRYIIEKDLEL
ncbi:glycosyltransferase family 2 protein [Ruminococcus sp. NK3A76]|uniref:glycosyltransferase family 2 protein n=1 Tax=Ruminococcus sp. NK3A76 TaxID=877411 RepID=UPI00048E5798|nr:glycosyltransferase family 2 protein [Ruminococcus sp. NK3A76]